MTPIVYGRAPRESWAAMPRVARGVLRLAAFVAAWWVLLALVARG